MTTSSLKHILWNQVRHELQRIYVFEVEEQNLRRML